jgi:transcriptional regulator with XRE-family HTH domain
MSGISQSVLSDWKKRYEEGKDSKLSVDNLKKLAEAMEVPITYFLED